MTGGWRKLHNEKIHNLYSSPSTIKMIKSRKNRWAEHIVRILKKRNAAGKARRKVDTRMTKKYVGG
jgi:hypothetical protein